MEIMVHLDDKTIQLSKKSNFMDLKKILLTKYGLLVKKFVFGEKNINIYWMVKDFPFFTLMVDPNHFQEYKKGQYRCSSCFKYLKYSNWVCAHTTKCRAKSLFAGESLTKIQAKYEEKSDEESINQILNNIFERRKQKMRNKINELLGSK